MRTLLRRRASSELEPSEPRDAAEVAAVPSRWTAGRSLASKGVTGLLLLTLLTGPVALTAALWPRPPAAVEAAESTPGLTAAEQSAGAYAASYVAAWLTATTSEPAGLETFVDVTSLRLGEQATEFRQLHVASVVPQTEALSSVVVTAFVNEPQAATAEGEEPSTAWMLRAFRVAVAAPADGPLTAVGLPAPIELPTSTAPIELGYGTAVTPADPLMATVREFFDSYLVGVGDITRYTTPGAAIAAITPAPYDGVEVDVLAAAGTVAESITDGTELRLLAQLQLTGGDGGSLAATYALTVVARDGQWEVSSLNPSPVPEQ